MATLRIIATPIGNLEDITHRAERLLRQSRVLACEDTRHTRILLARYGIEPPPIIFSYHEHNEESAGRRILDILASGIDVSLCTNAGTPAISDPGYRIIASAIEAGHTVEGLPGPSAVVSALAVSGLPVSSFTFLGFLPRKEGALRRILDAEKERPHTLIAYESPFRIRRLLIVAFETLGDRRCALCIELTKKFEQVRRGWLSELAVEFKDWKPRGEVTVVIAGNNPKFCRAQTSSASSTPAKAAPKHSNEPNQK